MGFAEKAGLRPWLGQETGGKEPPKKDGEVESLRISLAEARETIKRKDEEIGNLLGRLSAVEREVGDLRAKVVTFSVTGSGNAEVSGNETGNKSNVRQRLSPAEKQRRYRERMKARERSDG